MDAFYADVELFRYLKLIGLFVVIGGRVEHKHALRTDGTKHLYKLRNCWSRRYYDSAYEARQWADGYSIAAKI